MAGSLAAMAVRTAIAASDPATLISLSALQAAVDAGVSSHNTALSLISAYAQSNGGTAPTARDYQLAGVALFSQSGVDAVATLNSALASAPLSGTQADSTAKLQAISDAYATVLGFAAGTGTTPTVATACSPSCGAAR